MNHLRLPAQPVRAVDVPVDVPDTVHTDSPQSDA
jgi:hypothetical protein